MKHIIWDFNGTLLNDTQLSLDVDNNVFEKLGIPAITIDDYRNNMTMPVRVIDHLIFAGSTVYSMTKNSQFDGQQSEEELSYLIRSRNVPGRRGTLKQEQEEELAALNMDE